MEDEEFTEHSANSGEKTVRRVEDVLEDVGKTLTTVADGMSLIVSRLEKLELQKAAETVPETARAAVDQSIDTVGDTADVAGKAVDVPLAVTEDVIHDTGETVKDAGKTAETTRKKLFKKKR